MRELNHKELIEISGGDEPGYAFGYYLGQFASWLGEQLNAIGERAKSHSSRL